MIEVRNLAFGYPQGGFALSVTALAVAPGESVAVVGPSGCGKTTLLHLLAGILAPASGSVVVDGVDVAELGREDRQDFRALAVGLVFQEFELLDYLDVLDNVLLPYRVSPALTLDGEARQRAALLVEQVGLGEKRCSYPRRLSQGERQRVAVCRSLVTRPKVLFGDEPTANLDADNRDHVMDTLFRYRVEQRAPLVVVTHDRELHGRFDTVADVRELTA
ncbi:MAG: ATP-binding cassette domain-containing protein [bacterium]|nr:ATP-binding cassette domain-containing protein [bacterium]